MSEISSKVVEIIKNRLYVSDAASITPQMAMTPIPVNDFIAVLAQKIGCNFLSIIANGCGVLRWKYGFRVGH